MTSLYSYLNMKFLPGSNMSNSNSLKGHNSENNENSTLVLDIVGNLSTSTF
ncbi:hypothetical protein O3M35_001178 [Rhynocoris fuscipes]|uniref:Uncharacterized protein n=1 Tax=Rhynocoris fuscipes TaxID=488301 RepID=A0AAW1DR82_9HEMI